jgi:hypothetical protein
MVGFTLLSRSYYYLRRRSPGPPFPPDHRQAGERGAINNTNGTLRVLSATLFMLAVLLASPASSAGVHEAEIEGEGTGSQSPYTNVLPSCDGKRATVATHTEPSAKLITAHKAQHHCDGHAPTQTRDYY